MCTLRDLVPEGASAGEERDPEVARLDADGLVAFQAAAHRDWAVSFNDFLRRKGRAADVETAWPLPEDL